MNSGLIAALGTQPLKTQRIFNSPYGSFISIPNNIANASVNPTQNRVNNDTPGFQIKDSNNRKAFVVGSDGPNQRTIIFQSSQAAVGAITWLGFDRSVSLFFNSYIGTNSGFYSFFDSSPNFGRFAAANGNGVTPFFGFSDEGVANVVGMKNGTNAYALRLYNTYTSLTNFERFNIDWQTNPNTCVLGTSAGGSGTVRGMDFRVGATALMSMSSAGNIVTVGSTAGGYLHFSSNTIVGGFGGSITGRPVLSMAGGQGSSIIATVGGIVGTDCFGVSPAGGQANTNILGVFSSNTSYTITIGAARKNFNGAYTGNGHNTAVIGGTASSVGTGGAGGNLILSGGAAAGSGNNNGGNVTIVGGSATGTGTSGNVIITNLPTSSVGLPTGALWNDVGTLKIV
ncbi:MAG: hypothetical protein ACK5DE_02220 [Bacteroidota bacterium]|jgi:hypothetical protein